MRAVPPPSSPQRRRRLRVLLPLCGFAFVQVRPHGVRRRGRLVRVFLFSFFAFRHAPSLLAALRCPPPLRAGAALRCLAVTQEAPRGPEARGARYGSDALLNSRFRSLGAEFSMLHF